MNQVLQDFQQRIMRASAERQPLQLRGGGSKDWYGETPRGELLATTAYAGIIDYEPTELVITARCGTPLAEIEATLAAQHQMLAFEPPCFGQHATLGGMVAAGLSGPRRQAAGAVRDFVLGAVLMDGKGEVLHFGGQVMKNVAGYDVSRLLAGSLGTLGLLLEASLKVLPQPALRATRRFEASETQALQWLNQWGSQPLPISASAWHAGQLTLRLEGATAAVDSAQKKLGGEPVPDQEADAFWSAVREQSGSFFSGQQDLWRLSVPSTAPPLMLPGALLIEWGGAQRWLRSESTQAGAAAIRSAAVAVGGHAALWRSSDKSCGVFHPLAPAVAAIHRRLKASFDPAGIFNPGRMYRDL
jgi:glycolate oxidase FAD binding subunit